MPRWFLVDRSFKESGRAEHEKFMSRKTHRTLEIPYDFDERGDLQLVSGLVAYNCLKDGNPVKTYVSRHVSDKLVKPGETTFKLIEVQTIPQNQQGESVRILEERGYAGPFDFSIEEPAHRKRTYSAA